jgi:N-acyl homoserine lactone hydrolase
MPYGKSPPIPRALTVKTNDRRFCLNMLMGGNLNEQHLTLQSPIEGRNMKRKRACLFLTAAAVAFVSATLIQGGGQTASSAGHGEQVLRPLRLYVFDCGTLPIADTTLFGLKKEEVVTPDLSVACFLVVHPKGTLIWDPGAVPDTAWQPTGKPVIQHIVLPDSQQLSVTVIKPLKAQLAAVGYLPADITYLAFSHYHYDHTANANEFAGATWLVREVERNAMFAEKPPRLTQPSSYAALRNSKTVLIKSDDFDIFGDGTVVIKRAVGHTPGHQVLYVKLQKTGGVVLSGDLYHYAQQRTLNRVTTFDDNPEHTRASRVAIEAFLKKTGAQLWIQHDFISNAKLKKAPDYYD